jgi:SNF2 family DNA or RNA helicase
MSKYNLHPYQKDGLCWILPRRICGLFLPPGLGKSLITLSAIEILKASKDVDRVLIIAPLRVIYLVWPQEVKKWGFDFSVGILHGPNKDSVIREKHDIYLVNPEGLKWLFGNHSELFRKFEFMLVCDESTLFKNSSSQRFKLLKKFLSFFKRRVILTGTPAPNGLLQLWSQIFLLDKGLRLGRSMSAYKREYFIPSFDGFSFLLRDGAANKIYAKVDDLIMHKSHNELDLPECLHNVISVKLTDDIMLKYKSMKNEFVMELSNGDDSVFALSAATKSQKLKQIANGTLYGNSKEVIDIHNMKVTACEELVDSIGGNPVFIVYEYLHDLAKLKEVFNAPHIGGGVSGLELDKIVKNWNANKIPVLLYQCSAASHGLNLQDSDCGDVIWYSITPDLEAYEQVNKRVHRQGVKNSVTIHHIVALNTIDEKFMDVLDGKSDLQNGLLSYFLK